MQISVSGDLEKCVEEKVSVGEYASPSEVVCDALSRLREQSKCGEERIAELRREIMIGVDEIERGECGGWNVEETKAAGRKLFERGREVADA